MRSQPTQNIEQHLDELERQKGMRKFLNAFLVLDDSEPPLA